MDSQIVETQVEGYDPISAQQEIEELVARIEEFEQIPMPLTHHFSPGIYVREIFMPAGSFVVGHEHKTKHLNMVLSGSARVMMEGKIYDVQAPCVIESGPGVRKVLFIEEDMRWATIHANPDDEQDVVKLEERLINMSEEFRLAKGNMDIDTFRVSKNQKELQ